MFGLRRLAWCFGERLSLAVIDARIAEVPGSATPKTAQSQRKGGQAAKRAVREPDAAAVEISGYSPSAESRRVDDWGRSQRLEAALDRTLFDFLYHYWFRCEVEGIENVPSKGACLLMSNHAGALSADAIMIAKALREDHPSPRAVAIAADSAFRAFPGIAMVLPKLGCVAAHPANIERLLSEERQPVLCFPEGQRAQDKPFRSRYRLQRFGRGGFVASALGARAPIVPVCVVGAEESAPGFGQIPLLQRLAGLMYFPVTPTFPHLGLLGMAGYLPAKFKIRFLAPVQVDEPSLGYDRGLVQTVAQEVRSRIQANLFEMLGTRGSVWFG